MTSRITTARKDWNDVLRQQKDIPSHKFIAETIMELIGSYLAAKADGRKDACANMCAQIINKGYIIPLCFEKHQMITHRSVIEGIKACENNPLLNMQNWKVTFGEVEKKTNENDSGK